MTAFATRTRLIPIGPTVDSGGSTGSSLQILDGTTDVQAYIFQAKSTSQIIGGAFRSDGGSGTPPTYVMSLRNVDTTTSPATPGSTVHASQTFTPSSAAQTIEVTFSSGYTPTVGELLCLHITYSSGTINSSNRILPRVGIVGRGVTSLPFATFFDGASWSAYTAGTASFGIETSDGWTEEPGYSIADSTAASTNGHRVACKFQIPSEYATLDVVGFLMYSMPSISAAQSADAVLLDAGGELLTRTYDTDVLRAISGVRPAMFTSAQTLSAATDYRIGYERNGTNVSLRVLNVGVADHRAAYGYENNCFSSWNGSSWTDDTTQMVPMALVCSGYTLAASGGGSSLILPQTFSPMMSL